MRTRVLKAIEAFSSPNREKRVHPTMEHLIAEALQRRMASTILGTAFVMMRSTEAAGKEADLAPATGEERLAMIVLSEAEFHEIEVQFDKWIDTVTPVPYYEAAVFDHPEARGDDPLEAPGGGAAHDRNAKKDRSKIRESGDRLREKVNHFHAILRSGPAAVRRAQEEGGEDDEDMGDDGHRTVAAREMLADRPETEWDHFSKRNREKRVEEIEETRQRAIRATKTAAIEGSSAKGAGLPAPCLGLGRQANNGGSAARDWEMIMNDRRKEIFLPRTKEPLHRLVRIEFDTSEHPKLRLVFHQHTTSKELQQERERGALRTRIIDIRFFDDHARENWRKALSLALNRGGSANWQRHWDMPEGAIGGR